MFSNTITKDDVSESKVDSCGVCSWSVEANSFLLSSTGFIGVKRVIPMS